MKNRSIDKTNGTEKTMEHIFLKGSSKITLLLLHGSGGNERELLALAKEIDPNANILGLRGSIMEYGLPRFYKRISMGVFDTVSLVDETHNLVEYIRKAAGVYNFDPKKLVAIGYSSGATIAVSILFHYEKAFYKAILFHPMVASRNIDLVDLQGTEVFIGAGRLDQMMPQHEVEELTQMLQSANAVVEVFWTDYGHLLSRQEIEAARLWYHK